MKRLILLSVLCSGPLCAQTANGDALFRQRCGACHALTPGTQKVGPSLDKVAKRRAGSLPGFSYSPAMKASGLSWDAPTLDRYLANPQKTVPGTRMPLGVANKSEREIIVRYLLTRN